MEDIPVDVADDKTIYTVTIDVRSLQEIIKNFADNKVNYDKLTFVISKHKRRFKHQRRYKKAS